MALNYPESKLLNADDDEILVIEEDDEISLREKDFAKTEASEGSVKQTPWQVLVVDDEPAVYQATQLALKDFIFRDKPLAFLHATSGASAKALLNQYPGICFVLLDVVMETNDAGLQVVKYIRDV